LRILLNLGAKFCPFSSNFTDLVKFNAKRWQNFNKLIFGALDFRLFANDCRVSLPKFYRKFGKFIFEIFQNAVVLKKFILNGLKFALCCNFCAL
jgi:hypothetical protein